MGTKINAVEWIDDTYSDVTMGGGQQSAPSTTTTTQTSQPWAQQVPYLLSGFQGAQNLYQNYTPSYYPGSTVAPQSSDTQAAIAAEYARGATGSPVTTAADNAATKQLSNGGGYSSNPSNGIYSSVANSADPAVAQAAANSNSVPGAGILSGIANNNTPTVAQQDLSSTAAGAYLDPSSNPTLQAAIAAANQPITNAYQSTVVPGVASSFEAGNRYGSGAFQQGMNQANLSLGTDLSNADANLVANNYTQERQNQINAANDITTAQQNQTGIQANAANSLAANQNNATGLYGSLYGQNQATNLAGASGLATNYQNANQNQLGYSALAPTLANQDYTNLGAMSDAGTQMDNYNQALLNNKIAAYNYQQQLPYNQLDQYLGAIQGSYGGTSAGTSTTPYYSNSGSNFLGGALGGAASGAMLGSVVPGIGTAIGAIGGGLIGGLGSII